MDAIESTGLFIQLLISLACIYMAWKLYKFSRSNGWWMVGLSAALLGATIITLTAPRTEIWFDIRLIYIPIIDRIFLFIGIITSLYVMVSERKARVEAENKLSQNIRKIVKLTAIEKKREP